MLLMLALFLALVLLSAPVSMAIFISAMSYFAMAELPVITVVQRLAMGVNSFTLLAVPGFILAGNIMNTGGITKRIFGFAETLVGHITGGLGHANILASVIFAGMTGSAIADTAGLGSIELEAMREAGYDEDFSLAVTGASSTLGPIIPPSIPMVLFGVAAGASVGRLFMAGFLPGFLIALCMSVLVYIQCKKKNYRKKPRAAMREILVSLKEAFFPILAPVIIIGGMMLGIFTPTEAAMVAIVYSIMLSVLYRSVSGKQILQIMEESVNATVPVLFIVASANIFAWILAREQIPAKVMGVFARFIDSRAMALLAMIVFLLMVGCFLDPPVAIPIVTPVLMPIALNFGFDIIHFGIIMVLALMIGLLTPPIGMILFVLSSVGNVPFERVVKAVVPYVVVLMVSLLIIAFWPQMVLVVPNWVFGVQ